MFALNQSLIDRFKNAIRSKVKVRPDVVCIHRDGGIQLGGVISQGKSQSGISVPSNSNLSIARGCVAFGCVTSGCTIILNMTSDGKDSLSFASTEDTFSRRSLKGQGLLPVDLRVRLKVFSRVRERGQIRGVP